MCFLLWVFLKKKNYHSNKNKDREINNIEFGLRNESRWLVYRVWFEFPCLKFLYWLISKFHYFLVLKHLSLSFSRCSNFQQLEKIKKGNSRWSIRRKATYEIKKWKNLIVNKIVDNSSSLRSFLGWWNPQIILKEFESINDLLLILLIKRRISFCFLKNSYPKNDKLHLFFIWKCFSFL
jgi:hypothetical protein